MDAKHTTIRIPADLHRRLKAQARTAGRSMTDLAAEAVNAYLGTPDGDTAANAVARAAKVSKALYYLDRNYQTVTSSESARWASAARYYARADDETWGNLAILANINPLSDRSRKLVMDELRRRALEAKTPTDPFAGLPS